MKKAPKIEYGIEIVKPWSPAMYDHNDEVAEVVRAAVHQRWMDAWNECERAECDPESNGDLLIYMDWDVASEEMRRIQKAVTCYGFGSGFTVEDVSQRVEQEIENAAYYRLKDIAEELELQLEKGFVGF